MYLVPVKYKRCHTPYISSSSPRSPIFSSSISNQARMPAFTISIQHIIGSPRKSNQEKNKRHPASQAEKEAKLCLQRAHAHKQNTC